MGRRDQDQLHDNISSDAIALSMPPAYKSYPSNAVPALHHCRKLVRPLKLRHVHLRPAQMVTERTYLGAKATMLSDIRMFVALTAETAFTSGYGGEPPTRRRSAATSGEGISHRAALMCS